MFAMAGQTAESNGLNFFEETHGYPGGDISQINYNFIFIFDF